MKGSWNYRGNMRTIEVSLGGKIHTIRELPTQKNAAWRAELREPFQELAAQIEAAMDLELNDGAGMAGVVRAVTGLIMASPGRIADLVFAYSPELAAKRGSIEQDLYDSELGEAFLGILGLAFPFATMGRRALAMVQAISSPSVNKPTLTN